MILAHNPFPAKVLILIALLQGLALLFLHQAIDLDFWPGRHPQWLFGLYSIAFILPTMLLLGLDNTNATAFLKLTVPFVSVSALLGYYIGFQTTPIQHISYSAVLFSFVFTMCLATFKALMYSQQFSVSRELSYSTLYRWSWRNFLTLALSLLFTGCFWLILMLWAALFNAINIDVFEELFEEPWFYYPALALANGFGIIIFRNQTQIIDTITRLQQALMKFLLVLLVLVSLLFLSALPFSGLAPLWENGGSSLILGMQAALLFFINSVYQDSPESRPYPLWMHRFIYVGVLALPIYSAISFYGLSLRVEQYGWSMSRCWAFLIWSMLALFSIGYIVGIARRRDAWIESLSRVNVVVGLVLLISMLLVNSPMLDFRKIVSQNQVSRLASGQVDIKDFDVYYFRRHLARPGYEALQTLMVTSGDTHPSLVLRIQALYQDPDKTTTSSLTQAQFKSAITVLTDEVPESLIETLYEEALDSPWATGQTQAMYLSAVDANNDDELEFLWVTQRQSYVSMRLYAYNDATWEARTITSGLDSKARRIRFIDALKSGQISVAQPKWLDLQVGEERLQIKPD